MVNVLCGRLSVVSTLDCSRDAFLGAPGWLLQENKKNEKQQTNNSCRGLKYRRINFISGCNLH
jgi:hypothetical protein